MQLQPGESSILAYFASESNAQQVVEKLGQLGYTDIQVDQFSQYGKKYRTAVPSSNLSSLTLGVEASSFDRPYGPLLAADPSVSGLSSNQDFSGTYSFIVTVVTDRNQISEVRQILQEYGAIM